MEVGILGPKFVMPVGDDAFDYLVVPEGQIVLRTVRDLTHAVALLVWLIFALNIDYPQKCDTHLRSFKRSLLPLEVISVLSRCMN